MAVPAGEPPTRPAHEAAHAPVACPCCFHRTLERRADFEICPECGWEDDGQDDEDAHLVRGGPNGRLSLARARLDYLEEAAGESGASLAHGGEGLWRSEARRQVPDEVGRGSGRPPDARGVPDGAPSVRETVGPEDDACGTRGREPR
ncbi:CPCC family cysteine-rich protein [Streptomyces sp. NPDC089915]|uniref:CPCC family cysteine-rich protein n=1 Tax=Streptomyces sp. NPDC089915 TaxID=3155186 RepID=UPI0034232616